MNDIERVSPIKLNGSALKKEKIDNWDVVLAYADEGSGPWLVDLSHKPRFDLQGKRIGDMAPFGIGVPGAPGQTIIKEGLVLNRMNPTQVSIYGLGRNGGMPLPEEPEYTDVTEATLCVALLGKAVFSICEKLTALDFTDPDRTAPFLFQGPFSHVPCQIVTLDRDGDVPGITLTCSRGYGRDMIHSIMDAGAEFDLKPAGENRFADWFSGL